jgi:hypothetical protein
LNFSIFYHLVAFILTFVAFSTEQPNSCGPFVFPQDITDGIKIVQQDSNTYIVSVASVANSSNQNTKSRISVVRARRNVSDYINGTTITSETILETGEIVRNNSVEFYESFNERIVEQGSGFVEGMQVACTWVSDDGKNFFTAIFRELN